MSFVRSTLAFMVLLAASLLALAGAAAHWADRVAHTPAPMQRIIGPLNDDEVLPAALADTLGQTAKQSLPESVAQIPVLREQLDQIIVQAIDRALADPAVHRAWNASISASRTSLVSDLEDFREGEIDSPTVWFDLTPFVDLGLAKVQEISSDSVRPYLDQLQLEELRLPLGRPPSPQMGWAADAIAVAGAWPWLYLAAAVLAVVGLLAGSRRGRWIALIGTGIVGLVGIFLARGVVGSFGVSSGESIVTAVRARLINGTIESVLAWTEPMLYTGAAAIALGFLGLMVVSARRRVR